MEKGPLLQPGFGLACWFCCWLRPASPGCTCWFCWFRWHFERAWDLLGCNPMVLLFGAAILHSFKRPRVQAFRWLILGCAVCLIAANSLGEAQPAPISSWNTLVVVLPVMLVIGTAF